MLFVDKGTGPLCEPSQHVSSIISGIQSQILDRCNAINYSWSQWKHKYCYRLSAGVSQFIGCILSHNNDFCCSSMNSCDKWKAHTTSVIYVRRCCTLCRGLILAEVISCSHQVPSATERDCSSLLVETAARLQHYLIDSLIDWPIKEWWLG